MTDLYVSESRHWPFRADCPAGQQTPFTAGSPLEQVKQTPVVGFASEQPGAMLTHCPLSPRY